MSNQFLPWAWCEGRVVPIADARVPVGAQVVQYGVGVFGGIRGYLDQDGATINIFRLEDHLRRFGQSAALLKLTLPGPPEALARIVTDLTQRNGHTGDVYYRPFAYADGQGLGPSLSGSGFAVLMRPLGDPLPQAGLAVMVSSWRRVSDNTIPARGKIAGSYVNAALVREDAQVAGFDDAIVLNDRGKVAEGSVANLMLVRDGVLVTPPTTADVLEGITRRTMLQLAREGGVPVEERDVDRTELYVADEVMLCGTGAQVAPVTSIDRRPVGTGQAGPIVTELRRQFLDIVRGRASGHADWVTRVPVTESVQA